MILLQSALALFLAANGNGGGGEDPEYPLGKLRLPPIADKASPFRLVDLRYSFADDGSTVSSFETRVRVGASSFVGGEVRGERRGLSFDTQRLELGVTEENGLYQIESSLRAPRFLLGLNATEGENGWAVSSQGQARLSNDLELLLSYAENFDRSRFQPPPAGIPTTGEPPAPPLSRVLHSASAGLFYQRTNDLEVQGRAQLARVRTEASFDIDLQTYRLAGTWNRSSVEIDAGASYQRTSGRLASDEMSISLSAATEIGPYFLARGSTDQRWEPGIIRLQEDYRVGLTYFARRHRFARTGEAAERLLELQKQANALGYNERRVYDLDGLRRFRERLGISKARLELKDALDELYRSEVRDRNVPQLGFETGFGEDAVAGTRSHSYRVFFGVPWRVSLPFPFSLNEDAVEFVTAELVLKEDRYTAGALAISRTFGVTASLNREMDIRFRWERPGVTPLDRARGTRPSSRYTLSYEYAFGR